MPLTLAWAATTVVVPVVVVVLAVVATTPHQSPSSPLSPCMLSLFCLILIICLHLAPAEKFPRLQARAGDARSGAARAPCAERWGARDRPWNGDRKAEGWRLDINELSKDFAGPRINACVTTDAVDAGGGLGMKGVGDGGACGISGVGKGRDAMLKN